MTRHVLEPVNCEIYAEHRSSMEKVIIVGAGCTGCALGQGLKKAGIPCVIYEA